jgi:hypothetical protein
MVAGRTPGQAVSASVHRDYRGALWDSQLGPGPSELLCHRLISVCACSTRVMSSSYFHAALQQAGGQGIACERGREAPALARVNSSGADSTGGGAIRGLAASLSLDKVLKPAIGQVKPGDRDVPLRLRGTGNAPPALQNRMPQSSW